MMEEVKIKTSIHLQNKALGEGWINLNYEVEGFDALEKSLKRIARIHNRLIPEKGL